MILLGRGTTHCTNGIVIQRTPLTCALPPELVSTRPHTKRRSVTGISTDVLPYHSGRRQGPSPVAIDVNTVLQRTPEDSQYARVIDFGWMLCRKAFEDTLFTSIEDQRQVIPAWTSFNILLQMNEVPQKSCIGYCPVIEASPTELPTVFTLLKRSLQMGDQLNQSDVVVVLDQAIYAKALEVIWQNQEQFRRMVVRMGSFHIMCAFMAAIGKRFGDAGLADILIESGVVGSGSVAGVLEGKHYNRAVRMHKVWT